MEGERWEGVPAGGIIQEMGSGGRDGLDTGVEKKDEAVNNEI